MKVYLKLNTENGIISIPFKKIENADKFTVRYENMGTLINSIIEMLQLKIDMYDVSELYLSASAEEDSEKLPIKYSKDNFDYQSLYEQFVIYLNQDSRRLWKLNTKDIKSKIGNKLQDNGSIDAYEVELLTAAYFGMHGHEDTGYKRKREAYFLIKDTKGIRIKINPIESIKRDDLSIYSNGEDNYLNHLIELSKRNPEQFANLMDEIAKEDLESLSTLIKNQGYGIVDGVTEMTEINQGSIRHLEEMTGHKIEELRKMCVPSGKGRK